MFIVCVLFFLTHLICVGVVCWCVFLISLNVVFVFVCAALCLLVCKNAMCFVCCGVVVRFCYVFCGLCCVLSFCKLMCCLSAVL